MNSDSSVLLIVLTAVVMGFVIVIIVLNMRLKELKNASSVDLIKSDVTELTRGVAALQRSVSDRLDKNNDSMQNSMQKQLSESAKLVADVTQRLTKLDETNKRVVDVADELKSLQNVLSNPKQRGVLGEFYLKQILENMLPPGAFELQYRLGEGMVVDAIIRLDDRILPIDSKFSLENYNRLVEAKSDQRPALEKAFKDDLKKRIDETAKYIDTKKGTLGQALMFIPSEAIYYDLLANKVGSTGVNGRDLMQYAAVDKRVTIVGPSTLSAMLQIISQGLSSLEIQKDTEIIRNNVEQLGKHMQGFATYIEKVGTSLGATVGHFNNAQKQLTYVDKDVVKIAGGKSTIELTPVDRPNIEA